MFMHGAEMAGERLIVPNAFGRCGGQAKSRGLCDLGHI